MLGPSARRTRRQHEAAAFAESDARVAAPLAVGAHRHLVAVLEERARLTIRQCERLGPAPGAFEQTTARFGCRTGDRARAKEIAGSEIAAIARVVGEQLGGRPVEIRRIAC